jgi:hypothetical protein
MRRATIRQRTRVGRAWIGSPTTLLLGSKGGKKRRSKSRSRIKKKIKSRSKIKNRTPRRFLQSYSYS